MKLLSNKNAIQSRAYDSRCDIDLDPMTFNLYLDIVKMYHHTKNEVYMSKMSKVIAKEAHTDRQQTIRKHYQPA